MRAEGLLPHIRLRPSATPPRQHATSTARQQRASTARQQHAATTAARQQRCRQHSDPAQGRQHNAPACNPMCLRHQPATQRAPAHLTQPAFTLPQAYATARALHPSSTPNRLEGARVWPQPDRREELVRGAQPEALPGGRPQGLHSASHRHLRPQDRPVLLVNFRDRRREQGCGECSSTCTCTCLSMGILTRCPS